MFKSLLDHARSNNKTKQSIFKVKESKITYKLVLDSYAETFLNTINI